MNNRHTPPDFYVERLRPEDTEAMLEFHAGVWLDTFANEKYGLDWDEQKARLDRLRTPEDIEFVQRMTVEPLETAAQAWFVAKSANDIVGLTYPKRADDEGLQRVGGMYVAKEFRGKDVMRLHGTGVADALMQEVVNWSDGRPLYLWVAVMNERARRFYEKRNFETVPDESKILYGAVPHIKMRRRGGVA